MSTMSPLPKDHPIMVAWNKYKETSDYINTRQWASIKEYTDGALWAAFLEGWKSNSSLQNEEIIKQSVTSPSEDSPT